MYDTPSWGLLAPPAHKILKLFESMLAVRLAAVECPETAKFGNAGMEGGKEATKLMQSLVEGQQASPIFIPTGFPKEKTTTRFDAKLCLE